MGFQLLSVASFLLTLAAVIVVLAAGPIDVRQSISHHVARKKTIHRSYALIASASLVCIGLFFSAWLIPTFRISGFFNLLVAAAIGLEFITTWVPMTEGMSYTIHQICSYTVAALLPLILWIMLPHLNREAQTAVIFAIVSMLLFTFLFIFVKKSRHYYLLFQSTYILLFYTALIFIAYSY